MIRYIFRKTSLLVLQKIEIIDDEESDMISNSEVEQVNSLLDYKVKVFSDSEYLREDIKGGRLLQYLCTSLFHFHLIN